MVLRETVYARTGTEIKCFAVGGKNGKVLQPVGGREQRRSVDFIGGDVVEHNVGMEVVDFDNLVVRFIERHLRVVVRESDIVAPGMPVGVDETGDGIIRPGIQFHRFAVFHQQGAGVDFPHVHNHLGRVVPVKRMAVHAVMAGPVVGYDFFFAERRKVSLIDTHFVPVGIGRLYQAVGEVAVDRVGRDVEGERSVLVPLSVLPGIEGYGYRIARAFVQQALPLPGGNFDVRLSRHDEAGVLSRKQGFTLSTLRRAEVKGGDIDGNRRADIVGENSRADSEGAAVGRQLTVTGSEEKNGHTPKNGGREKSFHDLRCFVFIMNKLFGK